MLGPFATASCRTPHCHSPRVATVARRLRIDVHNSNDDDDNNDNAWQGGPLWPHRMGPVIFNYFRYFWVAGVLVNGSNKYSRDYKKLDRSIPIDGRRALDLA